MLMRGLLEGLFEQQVVLVTTSNQHPDQLYAHGLQRAQFLPAIELIKTNLEVVAARRRQRLPAADADARGRLSSAPRRRRRSRSGRSFPRRGGGGGNSQDRIEIEGRQILARRVAPGTIWFDFAELCEGPRGTADYIELARRYHTVLVAGVPQFRSDQVESLRRFTWLVDEFYDRQVKLILSAETTGRAAV